MSCAAYVSSGFATAAGVAGVCVGAGLGELLDDDVEVPVEPDAGAHGLLGVDPPSNAEKSRPLAAADWLPEGAVIGEGGGGREGIGGLLMISM